MKILLPVAVILVFCSHLLSQNELDFNYSIQSDVFQKERKYYVHLPARYYEDETTEFGVVYVLDAQGKEYFNNAKSIIDYLVWSYQIMPVIVVGIHVDNRNNEYIPLDESLSRNSPENSGQSHLLKEHIQKEIFPKIDESFRINQFRALIGHSRGGAFVANTLFSEDKDMFNAYLAISPGMHYVNRQILRDAEMMIKRKEKFNKFYYCTYGTVGSMEKYFKPQVEFIDSLLKVYPNNTLVWGKKEIEGASHWSCVAPSLIFGLLEMNRAYLVDQYLIDEFATNIDKGISEQIRNRTIKQKEILDFIIPIDAASLRYYGRQQTEYEQYKRALELFDLSIELDPNDVRSYWDKAWAFRKLEDFSNAIRTYKKAFEIVDLNQLNLPIEEVKNWKNNIQAELKKLQTE